MAPEARVTVLAVGVDPGELAGCRVESAEDLLGAVARLADRGIDVVLLSLDLPDGQGPDCVLAVRERAPKVPIVAIAADERAAAAAIEAGARDALTPEGTPGLLRAIRYASSLARLEDELDRLRSVDALTGLVNARGLELLAALELAAAERSGRTAVLVLVRLEAVDRVTGMSGRLAAAVIDAAEMLREATGPAGVLARLTEDAFCAIVTGDEASSAVSRIAEAAAESNDRAGRTDGPRMSIGEAAYDPDRPASLGELIEEAGGAMRTPEATERPG